MRVDLLSAICHLFDLLTVTGSHRDGDIALKTKKSALKAAYRDSDMDYYSVDAEDYVEMLSAIAEAIKG